ncbi:MAG: universal stress protein [Actinobacteria bacterium]|jgi:nucleotide-binding universal stress UspA family protein|nr:universal stress protein [Actinomycetota bacterium]MCO5299247.1 universal stress protein [Candidatus Nanopelagicales bacterium]MCB9430332.1 universal stress protein [Actinomycetota bacterium]HPE12830.1 universal stress protein [Actinomycetota bacterium]HPJ17860.1 universal stress protein [Actinomycetota bacterium]
MRYIVGYGPEHHGLDAINLAATLARTSGAKVDVVVVLPDDSPTFHMYSPDRAFNEELEAQAEEWLAEGQSHVPSDVSVTGRIQRAESIVEGLIAEAEDAERSSGDDLIVVGTSHRVRLGSIADALLHSSAVPVALAPIGFEPQREVTRITCATGVREGDEILLDYAIRTAAAWKVPLRLMSLIAVGEGGSEKRQQEWTKLAKLHLNHVAETAREKLPAECQVTTIVGHGTSMGDAVSRLEFAASEVAIVGSSRLAQPKRIFLGRTANKMMRVLAVPMIVVPRGY